MKTALLDTNVILRFVLDEQTKYHGQAVALFESAEHKEITLLITPEIMAEAIHVLRSYYEFSHLQISQALEKVILHVGVNLSDEAIMTDALNSYGRNKLDIADCLLAARSRQANYAIASFDKDFRKFKDVQVIDF